MAESEEKVLPMGLFMDLERSGPIPLYFQVSQRIEKAILNGELPVGSRLENEVGLAQRLGLSRPTVRRAIQDIVDKGLLVRRRGIGTQVVHGQVTRKVELTSLHDDLTNTMKTPSTHLLTFESVAADDTVAEKLSVVLGTPTLHIRRLRLADDVPVAVMENWLPEEFLTIAPDDLVTYGLYQVMRARGITLRVARQRISARKSTPEEAGLLDVEKNAALLTMDRTAFDNSGRAVEFGHHCYRPDLYSFEVTLVEK
ncbi:GntR family transcriptional regulator [Cryobacterium psychrophilum]|uniref:GntR family transcriptional regulator n=1 Tax=Cryobacterium psychrophilum TaxID=41988 RepID=A0A4Y8KMW5_9MICO|nr:GntR family transcriptional regulator [Cryobacterium psychrophilum]TFD79107.1 GntR family transcriptional regulator [Cryobacterium psychrophilum]